MANENQGDNESEGFGDDGVKEITDAAKSTFIAANCTKVFYNTLFDNGNGIPHEVALELTRQFLRDQFSGVGFFDVDKLK